MKIYLGLIVGAITLFVSCTSFNSRNPSNLDAKPRHFVITVHGLSGNAETWGHFSDITKGYLEQIDPTYQVDVSHFLYPTGVDETKGAAEFSDELGQFVKTLLTSKQLNPQDKISFVCHSQGGIITYLWYFSHILRQDADLKYVKQVDSIITLGTPFWGSKLASILTDKRNIDIIPLVKMFGGDQFKMTRREISDMSFSSDSIHLFRTLAIKLDTDERFTKTLEALPVRLINITGILPEDKNKVFAFDNQKTSSDFIKKVVNFIYKTFVKQGFGGKRVESDIAVIVPSSRWDFIYSKPYKVTQDLHVEESSFKHFTNLVDQSKFLTTESVHLPFDAENTLSMAYINKSCALVDTCNHPTYRYILEHLANCKQNKCVEDKRVGIIQKMKSVNGVDHDSFRGMINSLEAFSMQISIKLEPGQMDKFPVEYFRKKYSSAEVGHDVWELYEPSLVGKVINFKTNKKNVSVASTRDYVIKVGDRDETQSVDIVSKNSDSAHPYDRLRIHVTGLVESKVQTKNRSYTIPIEINLPGLPKVKVDAVVRPSYSTFVELDYTQ